MNNRAKQSGKKSGRPRSSIDSRVTLDKFVDLVYLPHVKVRKRSWGMDERIARKYISPFFGSRKIVSLTPPEIGAWHNDMHKKGFSPASCNRFLAVFKSILALSVQHGLLKISPCRNIACFRIYDQPERFLTPNEAGKLMAELEKDDKPVANAIRLLLLTGARKSEIIKAKWENLNLDRKILTVPVSKSGRPRHIVLSNMAARVLEKMAQERTGPWIFPGRTPEKPLSDIYHFWKKMRERLGLRDVRIHDLRHSFASFLINAGHSLYEVQKLLGHHDPRTTMRYSHLRQDSLIAATDLVSTLISDRMRG